MTEQTQIDLRRVEEIISQRRYELTQGNTYCMGGEPTQDQNPIFERISLSFIYWIVKLLSKF